MVIPPATSIRFHLTVMAGLDPAIQQLSDTLTFTMDGPVKPGHDNAGRQNSGLNCVSWPVSRP
jgi:hypothetical protein